ncbi:alpha/beta hydrolase [Nocardiopsis exhalans]|uniref:Alpha/beta hydrolase n=1 Tax=Nocardiopsis exhalans TaxID=163604 RepID=A0ABY5D441_9ACTN|nr:alpha/beta fold hydrolase [Nocardiopsis exhalans]USY19064.1 alpha/beta hydrolase [Nocardiopsis exhalans]
MKRGALLPLILVPGLAIPLMAPPALADPLPPAQNIDWETCGEEESPDAECGTLTVPIDWDDPDGEMIDLALARIPASDPDARIGSLVINPGGPGGSGVGFALFAQEVFSPEVLDRFDIVGFDPRGVGDSHPVLCSLEILEDDPGSLFDNRAGLDARAAYNEDLREDCREHTGPLYDHVDSLSVVHDMEAIRAALGDEQLSFFGVSYGTLMGQQYAATYPERVRAVVLDSVMDHDLDTRQYLSTQAEAAQDAFDAFVAWCEDSTQCELNGQDPRAVWTDLLKRADAGELLMEGPEGSGEVTAEGLIGMAFSSGYGPGWHDFASTLAWLDDPDNNELPVVDDDPAESADGPAGAAGAADEIPDGLVPYAYPAVLCNDYGLPVRGYGDWRALMRSGERLVAPDVRYGMLAVDDLANCLGQTDVRNPQAPTDVSGSEPLMVINSLHDPATGYNWAVNLADQLGDDGVLVTYEGAGHGVYGRTDCTTEVVDDYLIHQKLPAEGTRCEAAPVDFEEPLPLLEAVPDPDVESVADVLSRARGGDGRE